MANTGGQLSVVEEAGQMKAILSQITGEIIGITAQFSSETSVGYPLTFSIDEYGRYVAILDRTNFSQDDRDFTLKLTAQLTDGSSQQLTDYSFKWEVEKHDVASTPTSSGGSQAASTNIRAKAVSAVASHSTTSATSRTESSLSASSNVSQTQVSTGSTIASQPTGTITVENRNDAQGTFDVRITNVSSQQGISKVLVPTWTETNGQDDIIYHTADRQPDGSYLLKVNKSQHKNGTGKYNVHLYYRGFDGSMTYVAQTTTSLSEVSTTGNLSIANVNHQTGSFDVRITNVSSQQGISKVLVPTWTETNGQDDIIYHTADRQPDGSYLLKVNKSQHKNGTGRYNVHLYYRGFDGSMTYVAQTTTSLSEVSTTGNLSIANVNHQTGSFDVRITNVSSQQGISKVLVPTWTETNGQDDIIYHTADRQPDGSYLLKVNKSQHKNGTGRYNVHLYYRGFDGSMTYVAQTTTSLSEVSTTGNLSIANVNHQTGSFDVRITNISSQQGISKVLVPTWTETNGQDDIIYHTADRQPDGSYLLKVNKSQHKNGTGKYNVHLYYRGFDGSMTYVAQTTTSLSEVSTTGNLSIANVNHQTGSFDVRITNVSSQQGISKVLVPTWTETNGQDDIIYHTADRQPDGSYLLKVNKSQHKNGTGKYNVHLYYRGFDGSMTYVNATTVDLPSAPRSYTVYLDPGHGGRDSGASYGGIHEKNLAMSVANKLKDSLVQRGINVLMTRTGDYDVDYRTERSSLVNKSNADLFISLHFNATGAGVTDTKGIETYWYKYDPEYQPKINKEKHNDPTRLAESEILANKVQASLIKETGAVNRGVKRETFAVLRETAVPAILVELGFMDNPSELQVIKQDSYHTRLARALTEGVMAWYGAVGGKTIGTASLPISDMQKGFIDVLIPVIKQTSKVHSILPSVMLAQAILESAWGTSHLATKGNNLFGIKADETWTGDTIEIVTNEYRNGELKQEKQLFRKYNSWKESIADYGKFFTSTPWRTKNYQGYREATDYQQAIVALRQSGYATDPRYGEKLRSVIESYKLYRLDN
ncbi:N-acetylmuramoyl-L-alanine amidase [Streptococcus ruminantium]|nr:N-acetylmuramoyl-L-alanine amidase [Streptococcus ruminantium]